MKFLNTIKFRLTVSYLAAMVVLLLVFNGTAYFLLSRHLYKHLDDSLRFRMNEIQTCIEPDGAGGFTFDEKTSELVFIYDSNGRLVQSIGPNIAYTGLNQLATRALLGQYSFSTGKIPDGTELRFYATPFMIDPHTRIAVILGTLTEGTREILVTIIRILGASSLAVLLLSCLSGLVLANRSLKPVERITATAKNIEETDLSRRINVKSDDELGHMASTFNGMLDRLEAAFKRQRRFTADASHELRTPLSIVQAESTLALEKERTPDEYRKSLEVISQETSYMSSVIGDLLFLARNDVGKEPFQFDEINLKDLAAELSHEADILAQQKGISFKLGPTDNLLVKGDKVKLRQLFLNLLENAVKYTPGGGIVSLLTSRKDKTAVLSVSDTGIGIPPEHLPYIFDRFYRVDKDRSRAEGGTGLGLSIAWQIALAHGGNIEVQSSVGEGSTFQVLLPLLQN